MGQRKMRGMEFVCDQEWDDMKPTDGGRHCGQCNKTVVDFTGWSRDELITYFRTKPFTCGQYEPHQVDPTLIPIDNLGRGVRRGLFASIAALGLHAAQAQTVREPAATEQVIYEPQPKNATYGICVKPGYPNKGYEGVIEMRQPRHHNKQLRVYVSGRFPFLHIRRYALRGRRMRW